MKLPDFALYEPMNELRRAMGAELRYFVPAPSPGDLTVEEIEILAKEGLEIPLDEVRVLPDGTLAYKNQRVVLYIRDVKQHKHGAFAEKDLPRFHVSDCDTLQEMRANKRYHIRYVVATRDSGIFHVNLKPKNSPLYEKSEKKLRVCQNCLDKINWDDFVLKRHIEHRRNEIVQAFTLQNYFQAYGKTFINEMPMHTDATSPENTYTKQFKQIAETIKRKRKYRCDKCGGDFSQYKKYLHAHHIDGNQADDSERNIAILCIGDHAEQPYHGHMKQLPEYKEFMRLKKSGMFRN
jgi:hypothetical protein